MPKICSSICFQGHGVSVAIGCQWGYGRKMQKACAICHIISHFAIWQAIVGVQGSQKAPWYFELKK